MKQNTKKRFIFTEARIRKLSFPESGRTEYSDRGMNGLRLRLSSDKSRMYSYYGRFNDKRVRVTIGTTEEFSLKDARTEVIIIKLKIRNGINPSQANNKWKKNEVTLKECYQRYLEIKKSLKASTLKKYHQDTERFFGDWLNESMNSITRNQIIERFNKTSLISPSMANRAFRFLRALYNFALKEYRDENDDPVINSNPVEIITSHNLWNKLESRDTKIRNNDLSNWYFAINQLEQYSKNGKDWCDFFEILLFTGLRLSEGLSLKWSNIDFKDESMKIVDTKNGIPHRLPLTKRVKNLLLTRLKNKKSDYVFPSTSKVGHLVSPKRMVVRIREITGEHFIIHDIRRTFATSAESLGIQGELLKRLLNHSTKDVTESYVQRDIERLRKPMESIENRLNELINSTMPNQN